MSARRAARKRPGWRARSMRWLFAGRTRKVGAIPYAVGERGVEFLLVTSRRTGKWIFPKGGLIAGLNDAQSAAQEAFEEAGVEGVVSRWPLGRYMDTDSSGRRVEIRLYPLRVERELARWPEQAQRRRRWVTLEEAARLPLQPALLRLAEKMQREVIAAETRVAPPRTTPPATW